MKSQRGFSVVELLVALALFVAVGFALLGVSGTLLRATARSATAAGGSVELEQLLDGLRSDASTSFAVFVPDRDIFGKSNAPSHEVDFYGKDDAGNPVFWAYYYDPNAQTVRRFDYDSAGNVGQADRNSGAIRTSAQYPVFPGVTSFSAQTLEAGDLVGSKNVYASAIAPLFGRASPQAFPVGFDDGAGTRTDLYGGNTTVELRIATSHGSRLLHLSTAALPSGFSIHAAPEIRAIVYRHDTTDRSWLGLAQRSHVYINAQLLVSYTHFSEPHPLVWCDYNVFGNPDGLQAPLGSDADYQPTWFSETTAGIVYHVVHGKTNGARCSRTPPGPAGADTSGFFSPPPDSQDTPPPCFVVGQCWPPDAPPDFSPSPAPLVSPPAWWCATRPTSALCGRG